MDYRYFLFSANYRSQQNFTWEALRSAHQALSKIPIDTSGSRETVLKSLSEDLNIAEAIGLMWKIKPDAEILEKLFGLKKPAGDEKVSSDVQKLLTERNHAKQKKDFAKSDEIRKQIEDLGYEVMDTSEGQKLKKK
jgi:cysteinyl-tRNA synthetase